MSFSGKRVERDEAKKIGLESQAGAPRVSGAPDPGNSIEKHGAPDAAAGLRPNPRGELSWQ